jgi:hypothetical protein
MANTALLTHSEYLELVDTTDKSNIKDFVKIEKDKRETYLSDLIGRDLYNEVIEGDHTELLPLIKQCLAKEIQVFFINYQPLTPLGAVERRSDFATVASHKDKEAKVGAVTAVLRSYEKQLIALIEENEYESATGTEELSRQYPIGISAVGD